MSFIGIDQTGAVNSFGKPKPLPSCLIEDNKLSFFYLKQFSSELVNFKPEVVCIDCVLGLPNSVNISLRQAMALTQNIAGFGRSPAQHFFENLANGETHHRQLELQIGANSVFTVHPFQKNIQTGTFRFWKEMSVNPDWFYLPALSGEKNNRQNKIAVVEGYPSYYWKSLLKQPHRKPDLIIQILKKNYPMFKMNAEAKTQLYKDANLADALVLALAAQKYKNEINRRSSTEGWILGIK